MSISGSAFADTLPVGSTRKELSDRENMIVDAIESGHHLPLVWVELHAENDRHRATFFVLRDAIQIGVHGDSFRPNVTAIGHQRIADMFGAMLPTSKLVTLAWEQGFRFAPQTQIADAAMASTDRMLRHSREVDARIDGRPQLVAANAGKHWVLANKLDGLVVQGAQGAANFGWLRSGQSPWQPESYRHNIHHVDYSQVCWLIRCDAILDGRIVDVRAIGQNSETCDLIYGPTPLVFWKFDYDEPNVNEDPVPIPPPPHHSQWRSPLMIGMQGDDVAEWQRQLMRDGYSLEPWRDDGDFGTATHNATVSWQTERCLNPDGKVGSKTRGMIGTPPTAIPRPVDSDTKLVDAFKQARNYTPANRASVDLIVLHSMEAAEASTTAENVASWFAGTGAPKASAHYNVDSDSIVQSVLDKDIAWHAPGANHNGIGIEHAGYARQTAAEWDDAYSRRMLERSAKLCASLCEKFGIPVAFVDANGLRRGARGITTHHEVSKAFRKSDHYDPGASFPIERYLELIQAG